MSREESKTSFPAATVSISLAEYEYLLKKVEERPRDQGPYKKAFEEIMDFFVNGGTLLGYGAAEKVRDILVKNGITYTRNQRGDHELVLNK